MRYTRGLAWVMVALVVGCATKALPPVSVTVPVQPIDYLSEVKPILDKRCVVCHSCYNAACQLKLSSFEGTDRGATKQPVYDGARLRAVDPTRLFTDARSTKQWREKDFSSVTDSTLSKDMNNSIMIQLLSHKMKNPISVGEYHPETDELTCAKDQNELGGFLRKHPNRGMPYGFPPLKQEEFKIVAGWLAQGAKGPDAAQQAKLTTPEPSDAEKIRQWETFLNGADAKHAMTARYLYEHLFLAHIKFDTQTNEFYELVRSKTPTGQPIDIIPTVRPYDPPGVEEVFYRFRKIHSTIVHKTHMVVEFSDSTLQRFDELFIRPEWLQPPHLVGYDPKLSANPFAAFEQIPPRSRYQFLLDNAEYVIMTFIRGPVCKGQIALNVIDDQFWVMFLDPDYDLSVRHPDFLKSNLDKLILPTELGSNMRLFTALTDEHRKAEVEFYRTRQDFYASQNKVGLGYESIWKGSRPSDTPLLTVYRHFDSASVQKGVLGNLPKTMWVIDYPLFERIYYALVAGFDVYGNVGHQLAIRLYMDGLRIEGESYFLDYLPQAKRNEIMQSWYKNTDLNEIHYYPSLLPAKMAFATGDPKREFIEQVVNRHILPATNIAFDRINYLPAGADYPPLPKKFQTKEDYLMGFRSLSRPGTPFFSLINDSNANLAYLRIRVKSGKDVAGSIVINRWHNSVEYLIGEDKRLDRSKDSADFIPGLIGSYPNFFFDVREEDLPDFFDLLAHYDRSQKDMMRLAKYGINRSDGRFWDTYDWFQKRFQEEEPVEGGLFDLNRYYYKAK
jgi:hypothetical protein